MDHIRTLAKVDDLEVGTWMPKPEASATAVHGRIQVHVLLKGLLDFEEEKKRLKKQIASIEKEMAGSSKKLSNPQFMEKAPADIVEGVKKKVENMKEKLDKLNKNLSFIESIE
jgi:valyl-tRNA synthetase